MISRSMHKIIPLMALVSILTGCSARPTARPEPTTAPLVEPTAASVPANEAPVPTPEPAEAKQTWLTTDGGQIQFGAGQTSMHTPGDLEPGYAIRFHLTVGQGQQLNISLTSEPADSATLYISDASGMALNAGYTDTFSQVVPVAQEYYIEIRSLSSSPLTYFFAIDIPAGSIEPANGNNYEPIDAGLCQNLANGATEALGVDFRMQSSAPFLDILGGDAGLGCRLTAGGTGAQFSGAAGVMDTLRDTVALGFTEQTAYMADGPTGSSRAYARDMALMIMSSSWEPAMGVVCPDDQPIAACSLTPDQKVYSVQIDIAQFKANFSLDGHWQDVSGNFTLDLTQEWKTIGGRHTVVADGGNKIDSLDISITGMVKGQGADIQFQSSFTAEPGLARIEVIDPNTISWKIVQAPSGEFYLPAEATLTRY